MIIFSKITLGTLTLDALSFITSTRFIKNVFLYACSELYKHKGCDCFYKRFVKQYVKTICNMFTERYTITVRAYRHNYHNLFAQIWFSFFLSVYILKTHAAIHHVL